MFRYMASDFNIAEGIKDTLENVQSELNFRLAPYGDNGMWIAFEVMEKPHNIVQLNAVRVPESQEGNFITYTFDVSYSPDKGENQTLKVVMEALNNSVDRKTLRKTETTDLRRLDTVISLFIINCEDERLALPSDNRFLVYLEKYLNEVEGCELVSSVNGQAEVYPDGFKLGFDVVRERNLFHILITLDKYRLLTVMAASDRGADAYVEQGTIRDGINYETIGSFSVEPKRGDFMGVVDFRKNFRNLLRELDSYMARNTVRTSSRRLRLSATESEFRERFKKYYPFIIQNLKDVFSISESKFENGILEIKAKYKKCDITMRIDKKRASINISNGNKSGRLQIEIRGNEDKFKPAEALAQIIKSEVDNKIKENNL